VQIVYGQFAIFAAEWQGSAFSGIFFSA